MTTPPPPNQQQFQSFNKNDYLWSSINLIDENQSQDRVNAQNCNKTSKYLNHTGDEQKTADQNRLLCTNFQKYQQANHIQKNTTAQKYLDDIDYNYKIKFFTIGNYCLGISYCLYQVYLNIHNTAPAQEP